MALETAQYINSLDITNPAGLDSRTTADDHLRLIKASLKRTFPNVVSEVAATAQQINYAMGLSSTAQDQLNTLFTGKMSNSATAAFAISANYAQSAGFAANAQFAQTANFAAVAVYAGTATNATSAAFATSASNASYATSADNATSAVFANSATNATSAVRAVQLQHLGAIAVSAADYTAIGTSAKIIDGAGAQQPAGMNVTPIVPTAVSLALRIANAGMHIYGSAAGITISIDATTNSAPTGSVWTISNFQTAPTTMSITCTGSTLYWFDGIGTPSTGTRTLAPYGWCQITFYGGGYMIVGVGLT
jgi:hypothetical protein